MSENENSETVYGIGNKETQLAYDSAKELAKALVNDTGELFMLEGGFSAYIPVPTDGYLNHVLVTAKLVRRVKVDADESNSDAE